MYDREQDPLQAPEQQDTAYYSAEPPRKRSGWGCLVYGCLFTALAMLLLMLVLAVGTYYWAKSMVNQYTSPEPADLPVVEMPEEELLALKGRIESFHEKVKSGTDGEAPEPMKLVLTEEELNGLITENEDFRGKVHVKIENGQVSGEASIPTDKVWGGKGRYFNASVTLDVSLVRGVLIVTLADAQVNGKPLPEQFLEAMQDQNLAKDLYEKPEVAEIISQFDHLEVGDGQITLTATPRERPAETEQDASEAEEPAEEATDGPAEEPDF